MSEPLAQGCATFITEGPNAIKQIKTAGRPFVSHWLSSTSDRHKNPLCCTAFGPRAAGCTPLR